MQKAEGDYIFSKEDRERIKGRSLLPTDTLRYIEALETVAQAAIEVWKNTPRANKPTELTRAALTELYQRLSVIHFMDEDL